MPMTFKQKIFIRGQGAGDLNWEKGNEMKQIGPEEWVLEIQEDFSKLEFKVLIDDEIFEIGENHKISPGSSIRINPKFPKN